MEPNATTPTRSALLTVKEVEQRIGYRKSKLYQLVSAGAFPQPVRLGRRDIRFVDHEVDQWVAARIQERDATVGKAKPVLLTEQQIADAIGVSRSWLQKDASLEFRVGILRC